MAREYQVEVLLCRICVLLQADADGCRILGANESDLLTIPALGLGLLRGGISAQFSLLRSSVTFR